jgi:uncharacterized protein (DUF2141 family)
MKAMKTMQKIVLLAFIFICLNACTKGGTGGSASIIGKIQHHEKNIANARVFIKYDEKEFPGTDTTKYDAVVTADQQANYTFTGLKKGNYYLYAVGKDGVENGNPFDVFGGARIDINAKKEAVQFNVPVTEGD